MKALLQFVEACDEWNVEFVSIREWTLWYLEPSVLIGPVAMRHAVLTRAIEILTLAFCREKCPVSGQIHVPTQRKHVTFGKKIMSFNTKKNR